MTHILVFSPVYPPYKGGMGAVAAQEAKMMRSYYAVRVLTPKYRGKDEGNDEGVVYIAPWFAFGNAAMLPLNTMWTEVKQADIVHVHYPFFGTAFFALVFAWILRKRKIVTWHMRARAEEGAWIRKAIFFLHEIFEEPLVKRVADALCVSTKDYGEKMGIPKHKQYIVPFGIDGERFFVQRNEALRRENGVSEETCVFLFVGGMDTAHAFKGVEVLLRAYARNKEKKGRALWLVGEGNMRSVYEQQAQALGIQDQTHFFGGSSFEDLPKIYQGADVHVLPSVSEAEAYGLVTCEAAASGIPSIVSALPGVRMLVEHGRTGLHVEPKNEEELAVAMNRMAEGREERRAMGNAARKKMEQEVSCEVERSALLRAYALESTLKK